MARRIKYFGGQKQTHPIKDPKKVNDLLCYMFNQVYKAKSYIKRYQAHRNYILVLIGINTAFRAEDLLQLRVIDVENGYISIKENKTGKMQNFRMNKVLHGEILDYIKKYDLAKYDYMFRGQKRIEDGKAYIYPINRQQGHLIVSRAGKAIGLDITFGLHSLRKTFGYQYILKGGQILTLMKMYNHNDTETTQRYVLWGKEDAENDRSSFFIGKKLSKK